MVVQTEGLHDAAGSGEAVGSGIEEHGADDGFHSVCYHGVRSAAETSILDNVLINSGGEAGFSQERVTQILLANQVVPGPNWRAIACTKSVCGLWRQRRGVRTLGILEVVPLGAQDQANDGVSNGFEIPVLLDLVDCAVDGQRLKSACHLQCFSTQ